MSYDWDLIEQLLLHAQQCADEPYKAREYGEEVAEERLAQGEPLGGSVDHIKRVAGDLEGVLFDGGFIQDRPRDHGGTGNNFELTERGVRLLTLIGRSFPEHLVFRRLLDEQGEEALSAETFDTLAASAARDRIDDKPMI
ncbi:transcriptional regulator [Pseudomonas citronellolis]|uniref:transcriptional regulator n=1 Tax=Pseudomonas citronellolis TaxID=53408 RepID=UPI002271EF13|nr:transcriptional regulator [Pseudomonas citronellolis]WAB90660.1 transcriptional regulator [Pseudomonas citronellolis]WBG62223.1 transcriptional regulator [Pseudomonas citronellolis]